MQKLVTFVKWQPRRDFDSDNFECSVRFSVVDFALMGAPRGKESVHTIRVTMSADLMNTWGLADHMNPDVTPDMLRVALQIIEEHVTSLLKRGLPLEKNLELVSLTTRTAPNSCPYELANIHYPGKTSFVLDTDE